MPETEDEVKVLTLYYNTRDGDPEMIVEFITEKKNSGQKQSKTKHISYLYDGDIWVAKIAYSRATKSPGKLTATIRNIETSEKTYQAPSKKQLKTFFYETYHNYLKL